MSVATQTRGKTFKERLGFSPAMTPLVMVAGLLFLMASLPQLFALLDHDHVGPGYVRFSLGFLDRTADSWSLVQKQSMAGFDRRVIEFTLLAVPLLWLAGAIRSARVGRWQPVLVMLAATVVGALAFPLVAWLLRIVAWLWWLAGVVVGFVWTVLHYIGVFFSWISPVLLWLLIAALAVAAVYAAYESVRFINRAHHWLAVTIVVLLAGVLAVVVAEGWLDGVAAALASFLTTLGHWIGSVLGPVLHFVGQAIVFVVFLLIVLGIAVALLGQAGRTAYLPFVSAFRAGREQGKCIDFAAGVGVTLSLMLTAASIDPRFGGIFRRIWEGTPLLQKIPVPAPGYGVLFPSGSHGLLVKAFVGYNPTVDACLLALVALVGLVALVFNQPIWRAQEQSRIAMPIMVAVGVAVALAIFFIAIAIWANSQSDS